MTNILNFSDFQFESEQNNEQKAQDIVYDAWDSDSSVQRKRLSLSGKLCKWICTY